MNPGWLQLVEAHGPSLTLHVVRATTFLAVLPVIGHHLASRSVRLLLGVAVGVSMYHLHGHTVVAADSLAELGLLTAREALIGAAAGFAIHALFAMIAVAGDFIGHEMGLTMSNVLDPSTGRRTATTTALLEALAFLLILELNLHHDMLRVLLATYEHVGVGESFGIAGVVDMLRDTIAAALTLGVRLAAPVVAVLILTTVVLIVLARAIPNINLLEFSFGFRILVAMAVLGVAIRFALPFLGETLGAELHTLTDLFAPR